MSSIKAKTDAMLPPGTPPLMRAAVVLAPRGAWESVCEAMCTMASEGTESTALDGMMMARVWVARKSNL